MAVFHEPADLGLLFMGQHPGQHRADAAACADGVGSHLVVPGEHDHVQAHAPQLPDRLGAVLLDGVRHGDDPGQNPVLAEKQGGLALFG